MNISATTPVQQVTPRLEPPVTHAAQGANLTERAVQQIDSMKEADKQKKAGSNIDIKV